MSMLSVILIYSPCNYFHKLIRSVQLENSVVFFKCNLCRIFKDIAGEKHGRGKKIAYFNKEKK